MQIVFVVFSIAAACGVAGALSNRRAARDLRGAAGLDANSRRRVRLTVI
jgi:hypothetical protein